MNFKVHQDAHIRISFYSRVQIYFLQRVFEVIPAYAKYHRGIILKRKLLGKLKLNFSHFAYILEIDLNTGTLMSFLPPITQLCFKNAHCKSVKKVYTEAFLIDISTRFVKYTT